MGKLLVRFTVVLVAIYFTFCYYMAQCYGVDLLNYSYTLLFELITICYTFAEGKFHCKYLKFTMLSIFFADLLTRLDYTYDFLSVTAHNRIPIGILALGIATSITLAIRHFIQVIRLRNERRKTISHKADGISGVG
jgi:hypothetical protein